MLCRHSHPDDPTDDEDIRERCAIGGLQCTMYIGIGWGWGWALGGHEITKSRLCRLLASTMSLFQLWLFVLFGLHCVRTQSLTVEQHTALMSIYTSLGSSGLIHIKIFLVEFHDHSGFFFFFFFCLPCHTGCSPLTCPRFNQSSNCAGMGLICTNGQVVELCVL
jgi:hypothetical protein